MNNNVAMYSSGETKIPQTEFDNSGDKKISVSEHKLRCYFRDFMKSPKLSNAAWSFSVSGTWFLAATTGSFDDFLGIEGSGVALHLILYFGSAVFSLIGVALFIYWLAKGRDRNEDDFIELVMNGEIKKRRRWKNIRKWFKRNYRKWVARQKA